MCSPVSFVKSLINRHAYNVQEPLPRYVYKRTIVHLCFIGGPNVAWTSRNCNPHFNKAKSTVVQSPCAEFRAHLRQSLYLGAIHKLRLQYPEIFDDPPT